MKYLKYIMPLLILIVMSCNASKSARTPRTPKREVPIAINIRAENNATINFINLDYFRLQLIQDLDQFQEVNFLLVDSEENPEVVLELNLMNFTLWPRDERRTRRQVSRQIVVGTDAAKKPILQTVTALLDIIQIQRRSSARLQQISQ